MVTNTFFIILLSFDCVVYQLVEQLGVRNARSREELGIHAYLGEAGDGVRLVEQYLAVAAAHEEIDSRQTRAAERPEGVDGGGSDGLELLLGQAGGDMQLAVARRIFGVLIIEIVAGHYFADDGGYRLLVAEHGAFDLDAVNTLLEDYLFIEFKRLFAGGGKLVEGADLGNADGGAGVGGLHEYREAELIRGGLEQERLSAA